MKNVITLFFLMISMNGISQSSVDFNAVNPINFESYRSLNEINEANLADAYPWISPDGLRIYYTKEFSTGLEFVYTQRKDYQSDFSAPIIIPTEISEFTSCWLSVNELNAYVTDRSHLYYLHRTSPNSEFEPPIIIHLDGIPDYNFLSGPSLDRSQNELFISINETSIGYLKVVKFKRTSENSFSFEKYIELPFGFMPHLGQLSKDGLSLCVSVKQKEGHSKFYKLSRAYSEESFDLESFQELIGLNKLGGIISQLSMSSNMDWVVGITNSEGLWQNNDLFIVKKEFTSHTDKHRQPLNVMAYPNPTTGEIYINCGTSNVKVEIFNVMGQQIDRFISSSALVNYQIKEDGVYVVRVFTEHGIQSQQVIVSPF